MKIFKFLKCKKFKNKSNLSISDLQKLLELSIKDEEYEIASQLKKEIDDKNNEDNENI